MIGWILVDGIRCVNPSRAGVAEAPGELIHFEEGGAAVIMLQPRDYGRTRTSWTQQQGKADAINGQTRVFQGLKLDQMILWAL